MQEKSKLTIFLIFSALFLSGCLQNKAAPVQDYTGEGYVVESSKFPTLRRSKAKKIANSNKEQVISAVKEHFRNEYHTQVQVHDFANASNKVFAFVESINGPHFYSTAVVPVDTAKNKVNIDRIYSDEAEVQSAIASGLYKTAYAEKFENLDAFIVEIIGDFPVVGINQEVIQNTRGNNYETPYYYLKVYFDSVADAYLENPKISSREVKNLFDQENVEINDSEVGVSLVIRLHLEEKDVEPDEELYDAIYQRIEEATNLPAGDYTFKLYDNSISTARARGRDHNSIGKAIIKKRQ